jgi:hypothetical protein
VTSLPQACTIVCGVSGAPPVMGKTPTGVTKSDEPSWRVGSVWEAAHRRGNKLKRRLGFFGFFGLQAEIRRKGGIIYRGFDTHV